MSMIRRKLDGEGHVGLQILGWIGNTPRHVDRAAGEVDARGDRDHLRGERAVGEGIGGGACLLTGPEGGEVLFVGRARVCVSRSSAFVRRALPGDTTSPGSTALGREHQRRLRPLLLGRPRAGPARTLEPRAGFGPRGVRFPVPVVEADEELAGPYAVTLLGEDRFDPLRDRRVEGGFRSRQDPAADDDRLETALPGHAGGLDGAPAQGADSESDGDEEEDGGAGAGHAGSREGNGRPAK